jgi:hypothetical protein
MRPSYEEIYKAFYGKDYSPERDVAPSPGTSLSQKPTMTTAPEPVQDDTNAGECPSGHIFGADIDKYPDDCDICSQWDNCSDEADRLKNIPEEEKEVIPEEEPKPKEEVPKKTGIRKRGRLGKR